MVYRILAGLVTLFLVWGIVFQMIVPTYFNRSMFPIFRREKKLKDELTALNTEEEESRLEEVVEKRKKQVRKPKQ